MTEGREPLHADPAPVVFIGGHWLGRCERELTGSCDCDEAYAEIFNRCPECGADLDKWGDCTEYEEHLYA